MDLRIAAYFQGIEELRSQSKAAVFLWPGYRHRTHDPSVDIELGRAIHNPCSTVSERGSDAVRPDNG